MQDAPAVEESGPGVLGHGTADQFKREVAETFLRCIKERISHDNAVIELNGLKIAEDRTFADCARWPCAAEAGRAERPACLHAAGVCSRWQAVSPPRTDVEVQLDVRAGMGCCF